VGRGFALGNCLRARWTLSSAASRHDVPNDKGYNDDGGCNRHDGDCGGSDDHGGDHILVVSGNTFAASGTSASAARSRSSSSKSKPSGPSRWSKGKVRSLIFPSATAFA
jgi:hypothetical protein